MKHYKYQIILVTFIIILTSCKKSFLEVADKSAVTRQDYVVDLKTTGDFLNGIYIMLANNLYSQSYNQIYPEIVADNIKPNTSTSRYLNAHYYWSQVNDPIESNVNMNDIWITGYQIIRACSFAIEKAKEFRSQDPAKADDFVGQSLTIRSYVHFLLVNTFAQSFNFTVNASHPGIPYVTTHDWTVPVTKRETVAEVYNGIISDLNEAKQLLSPNSTNPRLMNRNAAKGLLARVYLFKEDFAGAKNLAREVSDLVPIMTSDYPANLFTDRETEALFQLHPAEYGVNATFSTNFQGRYFASPRRFLATGDIGTLLTQDPLDARKIWVTASSGNWRIAKYPQGVIPGFSVPSASYYQTLIRSSEMYLIAAECYANLNNDSARYYLDAIRQRANPAALPSTATGADLLDSIYVERRKELAFEGLRMFDLLRWKKGVNRTDAWNSGLKILPYPSSKAIAPIPYREIELSGLQQNPSY